MNVPSLRKPADVFEGFAEAGGNFLQQIRQVVTAPGQSKRMRRWGIQEAATLIGRSAQSLRQSEANDARFTAAPLGPVERDGSGNRAYTLERINAYRNLFGTRLRRPAGARAIRCAVTNFKGGAGKTTTAVHLAQKCALEGLRVLMVDLDPQATTTLFFGLIPDLHVEPEQTIGEILVENPALLRTVIQPSYFTGIDLVAANLSLQDAELTLANPAVNQQARSGLSAVERLEQALASVEDEYDVIVMDCGPNLGILTLNAVHAASGLLVPMQPAMADFGSAVLFFQAMASLMSHPNFARPMEFIRILITRHTGNKEAKDTEAMIRLAFRPFVLDPVMVQTIEVERASNDFGAVYDIEKPRGTPEAYRRALTAIDATNEAMIEIFKDVWAQQALRAA